MKPPQWANNRGIAVLLLLVAFLTVGCTPSEPEKSPPKKKNTPAANAPKDTKTSDNKSETAGKTEGPAETDAAPPLPDDETASQPKKEGPDEADATPPSADDKTDPTAKQTAPANQSAPVADAKKTADDKQPKTENEEPTASPDLAPQAPNLGPPLGEDVKKLRKLQPDPVLWIDPKGHRVIMVGQVCQRNALLELFACTRNKEHESVVVVPTEAWFVHAGLLAVGAKQGRPVQFHPEYKKATGTEVEVFVRWKDEKGKIRSARAQDWVRNMDTGKAMKHNWVFGGSRIWTDKSGKRRYEADSGDFICVSNFPSAMLDVPIRSSQSEAELLYEAFTENIPPLGTPVTVILKPKLEKKDSAVSKEPEAKKAGSKSPEGKSSAKDPA
jgi:hypothetical protein